MTDTFSVRDQRKAGHHWADNEVLDKYAEHIGFTGYAIYMFLCRHAGNRNARCYKTQREIADAFGSSRDTVNRYIAILQQTGLIAIEEGQANSRIYVILEIDKLVTPLVRNSDSHETPPLSEIQTGLSEIQTGLSEIQTSNKEENNTHIKLNKNSLTHNSLGTLFEKQWTKLDLANALHAVFSYYLSSVKRNPKLYTLTPDRQKCGEERLRYCLQKTSNDISNAIELMKCAVDGLCSSEFHMGNNQSHKKFVEWEKHLFKSDSQMEKWWNA